VTFTFLLAAEDPATLVRSARAAGGRRRGRQEDEVKINVAKPRGPGQGHARTAAGSARECRDAAGAPAMEQPNLGKIIRDFSSARAGGKSTVAATRGSL